MFSEYSTSQIIGFINSLIRNDKVNDYMYLFNDALSELEQRSHNIALLYKCYLNFNDKDG